MGREVRMVPPNWEHPKTERPNYRRQVMEECYQPMFDEDAETAWADWQASYAEWIASKFAEIRAEHPEYNYRADEPYAAYCHYHGRPPDAAYYRPKWRNDERTWFQVYETVSEGTPVTPPFATREELVDYLVENGDFWDQQRRTEGRSGINCDPWRREVAHNFVFGPGWAPSFAVIDGEVLSGPESVMPQASA